MSICYSIIIPTCGRENILKRALEHLVLLDSPEEGWEVVVIDNASKDNTREVVESFKETLPNLSYYYEARPGLHFGRHLGCEKARGEILCYIDDDSFVDKGWLIGIEKAFSDKDVVMVGGPNLPEYESEPPKWLDDFWSECEYGKTNGWLSLLDFGDKEKEVSPYYIYGCNFNIRRGLFIELGGTHPDCVPKRLQRYQGDGESALSRKVLESGKVALYSPLVKIHHHVSALRITREYFYERAFYQGVADSFGGIRRDKGLDGGVVEAEGKPTLLDHLLYLVKNFFGLFGAVSRREGSGKEGSEGPSSNTELEADAELKAVIEETKRGYKDGYDFHRGEVDGDPRLLEYVLREDFMGDMGHYPDSTEVIENVK